LEVHVDAPRSQWGLVRGTARLVSGQPAAECGVISEATTLPAAGVPDVLPLVSADGSYVVELPAGIYTIKVSGTSGSGTDLYGEVTGVVVTSGSEVRADVTVMERHG
jgi:hypothetical protein